MERARDAESRITRSVTDADLSVIGLDLSSLASVERFATEFEDRYDRLDALVNNAGVMMPPFSTSEDGFELQIGVNFLGHYLDTWLETWLPSYNVLHADEWVVVVQYFLPFLPPPYRSVLFSGNLLRFPLLLRNGWIHSELITSHERLSQLQAAFEATDLTHELVSVTQSTEPTALLTDRQQWLITEATKRGYYDSPRDCTLTELAAALDLSKSVVSGILHRAEGQIIKQFLGEPIESEDR